MDELIKQKELFIESASSFFDRFASNAEAFILDTLYGILDNFDGVGSISNTAGNRKKINAVNKTIFEALKESKFSSEARNFIKNFDTVEEFQLSIVKQLNPSLRLNNIKFNKQKNEIADEIIKSVTNKQMLENQIAKPLKRIMQQHVSKGITYKQAREEIRNYVLKDENKRGLIGSRVNILARESLLRFDGSINQKLVTDFDLDAFRIVGSLIKTSEPVCREMVKGTGRFSGMMVNGKYAVKDIPKIIDKIRNDKAFVEGTNEDNYFKNRNHWGCRHTFIPTKFLKRDLENI